MVSGRGFLKKRVGTEPCPSGTNRVCETRVTDTGSYPRPRPSSLPSLTTISSTFSPPLSSLPSRC